MKPMKTMLPFNTLSLENITKYDKYFCKVNTVNILVKLTQLTSMNACKYMYAVFFNIQYTVHLNY